VPLSHGPRFDLWWTGPRLLAELPPSIAREIDAHAREQRRARITVEYVDSRTAAEDGAAPRRAKPKLVMSDPFASSASGPNLVVSDPFASSDAPNLVMSDPFAGANDPFAGLLDPLANAGTDSVSFDTAECESVSFDTSTSDAAAATGEAAEEGWSTLDDGRWVLRMPPGAPKPEYATIVVEHEEGARMRHDGQGGRQSTAC
jgi:hypothetical protein